MSGFKLEQSPYPRQQLKKFEANSISGLPFILRASIVLFDIGMLLGFLPALFIIPGAARESWNQESLMKGLFFTLFFLGYPVVFSGRMARKRWGYGLARFVAAAVLIYILTDFPWLRIIRSWQDDDWFPVAILISLALGSSLAAIGYHIVYKNTAPDPKWK